MTPYFDPDNYTDADATAEDYLQTASDIVASLAPPPAPPPLPEDYPARAARAERLVYNWLVSTRGGTLTGKGGIPGATGSKSFAEQRVVQNIVKNAMGPYYVSGSSAPAPIRRPGRRPYPYVLEDPLNLGRIG